MTFPDLMSRSFNLWWRHKGLWVIGIVLALCGRGDYNLSSNVQQSIPSNASTFNPPPGVETPEDLVEQLTSPELIASIVPIVLGVIVCGIVLAIVLALLGAWANGALVQMANAADRGEPIGVGAAFGAGRPFMLPIFGIELLLALPFLLLILVVVVIFIATLIPVIQSIESESPEAAFGLLGGLFCLIPLVLLGVLLNAVLKLIGRLAVRACVLEGLGVGGSISQGWRLMRKNIGYTLLIWFVLLIAGLIFGVVATLPVLALVFALLPAMMNGSVGAIGGAVAGLILYSLLAGAVGGGILTSFNGTLWTLAYRWFVARSAPPPPPSAYYG